jgi:hypothetical protein
VKIARRVLVPPISPLNTRIEAACILNGYKVMRL